ncbi:hypothetical protein JOB18_050051 [Solea senegalensis]|uniref:Uncharacterized protein n=1 Tax=Solea senegalensis TaxID=28829 RepID=A0AAV6R3U1_SOLSE|nr:hypothetical protein JOB18_050051 [Solea senegalensis]
MLLKWTFCVWWLVTSSSFASPAESREEEEGESGSGMMMTMTQQSDEVNVLQELSLQVSISSNVSMTAEDGQCPVLQVGQYSTLALPLHQLFTDRFPAEFSLLVQLQSPQREERSVFTALSRRGHVVLQLRISASAVVVAGTQRRHYDVSAKQLAVYVDCSLLESVDWFYHGLGVSTDGLLMVGGVTEDSETTFEGRLKQLTFMMDDPGAARLHCSHHPPRCTEAPRSPRTSSSTSSSGGGSIIPEENVLLSSNDLEDLLSKPDDESLMSLRTTEKSVEMDVRRQRADLRDAEEQWMKSLQRAAPVRAVAPEQDMYQSQETNNAVAPQLETFCFKGDGSRP